MSGYDIYSLNSAPIKAEANWWDTSVLNGNVDTTPTADNVWRGPLFKSTGSDGDNDGPPLPAAILEGDQLAADSLYDDAVSAYQSFITLNPADDWTLTALGRIVSTAKNAQRDSTWQGSLNDSVLLTILDNLSSAYETEAVGLKALAYSVSVSMTLGNTADALERNSTLIDLYTQLEYNDEDMAFALLEQAIIQELIGEESLGKTTAEYSKAGYQEIIDEYPGTIAAHEARILMGKFPGELSEGMTIPTEYALNPAYPNPFNPVTTLSYALPTDSYTQLVIYDLRGREVRTLVNRAETAGQKTLRWDGRNNVGIPVASGVYIYALTARALNSDESFTANRKLVLLK